LNVPVSVISPGILPSPEERAVIWNVPESRSGDEVVMRNSPDCDTHDLSPPTKYSSIRAKACGVVGRGGSGGTTGTVVPAAGRPAGKACKPTNHPGAPADVIVTTHPSESEKKVAVPESEPLTTPVTVPERLPSSVGSVPPPQEAASNPATSRGLRASARCGVMRACRFG
jgi:hypothetical protein